MNRQDGLSLLNPAQTLVFLMHALAAVLLAGRLVIHPAWLAMLTVAVIVMSAAHGCFDETLYAINKRRRSKHRRNARTKKSRSGPLTPIQRVLIGIALSATALGLLLIIGFAPVRGNGLFPALGGGALLFVMIGEIASRASSRMTALLQGLMHLMIYLAAAWCISISLPAVWGLAAISIMLYQTAVMLLAGKKPNTNQRYRWRAALLLVPVSYGLWLVVDGTGSAWHWQLALVGGLTGWLLLCLRRTLLAARKPMPPSPAMLLAGICLVDAIVIAGAGHARLAAVPVIVFVALVASPALTLSTPRSRH